MVENTLGTLCSEFAVQRACQCATSATVWGHQLSPYSIALASIHQALDLSANTRAQKDYFLTSRILAILRSVSTRPRSQKPLQTSLYDPQQPALPKKTLKAEICTQISWMYVNVMCNRLNMPRVCLSSSHLQAAQQRYQCQLSMRRPFI